MVVVVYGQTIGFPYANLDDKDYVSENPHVAGGLTAQGIAWAFTETHRAAHWHPLTWLSLMLDSDLFGIEHPGGYHLTNVILHTANAVILFLLLRDLTAAVWPSAFVAAVFAVHPVHVESVVWITERKDMLSGLFGLLALWAYARYASRPSMGRYLAVVVALALGLMAKPVLVTWPAIFLLLDYWPLKRPFGFELLLEKLPLLLLAAASSAITIVAQKSAGTMISLDSTPVSGRILRAAVLYAGYVRKTFWPANLTVSTSDSSVHFWTALAAVTLLVTVTVLALWCARGGHRSMAVGWLWFLIAMLPTIGLIQVGAQVEADRFLYLPQIGLCLAVAWAAASWLPQRNGRLRCIFAVAAGLSVSGLAVCAWRQTAYWRDSIVLWDHALELAPGDYYIRYTRANALADHGRMKEAIAEYQRSLAINPKYADTYDNLGAALGTCEQFDDAIACFQKALALQPDLAAAHGNLGVALLRRDRAEDLGDAIIHLRKALDYDRDSTTMQNALGIGLMRAKKFDEAIDLFQQVLKLKPDDIGARQNLEFVRALKRETPPSAPPIHNGSP
jgi:Flp pilus assembly protein TadD